MKALLCDALMKEIEAARTEREALRNNKNEKLKSWFRDGVQHAIYTLKLTNGRRLIPLVVRGKSLSGYNFKH